MVINHLLNGMILQVATTYKSSNNPLSMRQSSITFLPSKGLLTIIVS